MRAGMGRRIPSDLVAWVGLNNGFKERGWFGNLVPTLHTPLPVEKMLPRREMLRSIYADRVRPGEVEPAGTRSVEWVDGFLPISDTGTDLELVVDLRDGELNGCVGEFSAEAGGFSSPYWLSVGEMLADIADALTLGRPAGLEYARRRLAAGPGTTAYAWEPYLLGEEDEDEVVELHWSHVTIDEQQVTG